MKSLRSLVPTPALFILSLFLFAHLPTSALAIDYRGTPAQVAGLFEENNAAKLAASLGIASGSLKQKDVRAIAEAINKRRAIPGNVSLEWQKLMRMAYSILYLQSTERFYSVGYEFETVHKNRISWEEWRKGSKAYADLVAGTFGVDRAVAFEPEADDRYPKTRIYDEEGRLWSLTTEHVRITEMKSGYELGTPPVTRPAELEQMASFRWRLGEHWIGQSNPMTGAHQTYMPFPVGEANISDAMAGRVAANLQLLHAQYGVAIHELMDVKRMGGAVDNFFFRPVIFDHYELLQEFSRSNPGTLTLARVRQLLFDKYIEKEVEVQLKNLIKMEIYDESDAKKVRAYSKEDKAKFVTAWKYRDTQLKINLDGPGPRLLWESRIGDYVADQPEKAMLKTLIDELLIDKAWRLAKEGKLFQLTIPPRLPGESEADYWSKLQVRPDATPEAFLEAMDLQDQNVKRMILGKSFHVPNFGFKAGPRLAHAFEMEGWTESVVKVILPRDPELRAKWRKMNNSQRIRALADRGYDFEDEFSWNGMRAFVTEFYFDHQKYPYGHPQLHVEASGNWEVKSMPGTLFDMAALEEAVRETGRNLGDFGLHVHAFLPEPLLKRISGGRSQLYSKFLELQSFYMSVQGYAESLAGDAGHELDSWSLDRYSPTEVQQVRDHLTGKIKLGSGAQKYHNIGFRPVPGGLDVEIRDIGGDVDYGLRQLDIQLEFVRSPDILPRVVKDPPLFMEFRENANADLARRYTLEEAVGKKYSLTPEQKTLLRLFQFEIYKPVMEDYMYFKDFSALAETPDKDLDAAFVRTNFENNIAIPLLNYEEQSLFNREEQKLLAQEKDAFIDRIYQRLLQVEKDSKYAFLKENENFLHLCEYLKRSKHPTRPKFGRISEALAETQRELLNDLVFDLRGEVVTFVQKTKINRMLGGALEAFQCATTLKPRQRRSR